MTIYPMPETQKAFTSNAISDDEIMYYQYRLRNRIFNELIKAFSEAEESKNITRVKLAENIGVKPEQITRWLSSPCNYTLDTVAKILLGLGAELDSKVVFLSERNPTNYVPELTEFLMAPSNQITNESSSTHTGSNSAVFVEKTSE